MIGAFVMGVMNNGMSILGIGIDWQKVIKGSCSSLPCLSTCTSVTRPANRRPKQTARFSGALCGVVLQLRPNNPVLWSRAGNELQRFLPGRCGQKKTARRQSTGQSRRTAIKGMNMRPTDAGQQLNPLLPATRSTSIS